MNMLSFKDFITLDEAFAPQEYKSSSGNVVSHSYTLPSGKHKIDILYTKIKSPDKKDTGTWMVDFKRTQVDPSGKAGSSTFDRKGMSKLDSRDRVHGVMAVRHSLKNFVSGEKPYKVTYTANTKKKGAFYKNAFDNHVIGHYNKQNSLEPSHEHAAKPGYAGTGMVFPRNEPK